jgi:protein-disulfide isomerase
VAAVVGVGLLVTLGMATQGQHGIGRLAGINASGRTLGRAAAPVKVIEFADYQCPHCKQFEQTMSQQLQEQYIAKGLVQLEFRNLTVVGDESVNAAQAAQCADDQGKFWEYHDLLFEGQRGENSGAFSPEHLVDFAQQLGLDLDSFTRCMNEGKYQQLVEDEGAAAREEGAHGTPFFIVTGPDGQSTTVAALRSFDQLAAVIDEQLAGAGSAS